MELTEEMLKKIIKESVRELSTNVVEELKTNVEAQMLKTQRELAEFMVQELTKLKKMVDELQERFNAQSKASIDGALREDITEIKGSIEKLHDESEKNKELIIKTRESSIKGTNATIESLNNVYQNLVDMINSFSKQDYK